jgi:linoleoyl-CoA desaturase
MSKITFNNRNGVFYTSLKKEVENYFAERRIKKTGNWKLYLKSGVLLPASILIYVSLLVFHWPVAGIILLGALLGFVQAGIGFNVMHDANHGSFSSRRWVNNLMGLTMNALGSNAFIWKQKHNIIHHTYTNIDGLDDDIAKTPIIRMCSTQKWLPVHRIQHLYLPFAYALSSILWTFVTDYIKYFGNKVHTTNLQKMDWKEHVIFWSSKLLYVGFYILIPILLKGWLFWLLFFCSLHVIFGLTLAFVFQLAHVVEHTEFEATTEDPKVIESEWAVFQLKTTSNFAMKSKVISWLVGGLNFQIEHHLFPRVSHVHYPALSKIVEKLCREHKLPYNYFPTIWQAIGSHIRFMKRMGQKPQLALA